MRSSTRSAILLIAFCITLPADAMFMRMDRNVPLETILPRIEERVKEHPDDTHAVYLLGRVHSLAWAADGEQVRLIAGKADDLPSFAPYDSVQVTHDAAKPLTPGASQHLEQSIAAYRKAVDLDPKNGLYHLGLAWMLEQKLASQAKLPTTQSTQPSDQMPDMKMIIAEYVKAFDLRLEEDKSKTNRIMAGDAFVSSEAADDAIRLIKALDPVDTVLIERLEAGKREIFAKGMAVTPIVVAMHEHAAMTDLIDAHAAVAFDFAGFGPHYRWPWLTRDAGLLVWDPAATGHITSGRQLFGTMTWQMLFRDGYEPLALLDRNHDGVLNGDELRGIGLWRDANTNAVSDAGEVVPASQAGIVSIDLHATHDPAGVLRNEAGIHWKDGRTTGSFDWVPESK